MYKRQVLSDVGAGNPKNIIEVVDSMLNGFESDAKYEHLRDDQQFPPDECKRPAIEIVDNHCVEIVRRPLASWPCPRKIVGYVDQEYEALPVDLQCVDPAPFPIRNRAEL